MKKRAQRHQLKEYYRQMEKKMRLMEHGYEPESVHRFRLSYKKMKAFINMLATLGHKKGAWISGKLKEVYRLSGSIRDLQLQQMQKAGTTIEEKAKERTYRKILQENLELQKHKLSDVLSGKLIPKSERRSEKVVGSRISVKDFRKFIDKKWTDLKLLVAAKTLNDDRLHKVRKELKDLSYVCIPFRKSARYLDLPVLQQLKQTHYKELTEQLGNFQNQCKAIAMLKAVAASRSGTPEGERMKAKIKMMLAAKKGAKQSLIAELRIRVQ